MCSMKALQWGDAQAYHVSEGTTLLAAPWRYHAAELADFAPVHPHSPDFLLFLLVCTIIITFHDMKWVV